MNYYENPDLECSLRPLLTPSLTQTHLYVTTREQSSYVCLIVICKSVCLSATTSLCTNTAHFLLKTIRSEEARHWCGRALAQVLNLHLLRCRSICLGVNAHG